MVLEPLKVHLDDPASVIACGYTHACIINREQTKLMSFGRNNRQQLGWQKREPIRIDLDGHRSAKQITIDFVFGDINRE